MTFKTINWVVNILIRLTDIQLCVFQILVALTILTKFGYHLIVTLYFAARLFVPVRREGQLHPAVGAAPLAEPRRPIRHSGIQVTIVELDTWSEFDHLFGLSRYCTTNKMISSQPEFDLFQAVEEDQAEAEAGGLPAQRRGSDCGGWFNYMVTLIFSVKLSCPFILCI